MDFEIEKIEESNYNLFDDMVFWRKNGFERISEKSPVSEKIKKELSNPYFYAYAVKTENKFVGWISLIYLPKIGLWQGKGHIYVDELWVEPSFRGNGFAKELMKKADELKEEFDATGVRLYVNFNNPVAKNLYEKCGYEEAGSAYFMEK